MYLGTKLGVEIHKFLIQRLWAILVEHNLFLLVTTTSSEQDLMQEYFTIGV